MKDYQRIVVSSLCALLFISVVPVMAQSSLLEEILVTAQKREQSAQDVSVSITAYSGELIKDLGIRRPRDIAAFTPGLQMNASSVVESDPIFTLRGIGMNDVVSNQNPSVTPYLDGVALASHIMLGFQIFDIERVEVLKGPQGTLYGRNTTGGAIKFIANKPSHEFDLQGQLGLGELSRMEFEGAIGGGLTDTLAGRLAVSINQRDGWQTLRLGPTSGAGVDEDNGEVDRKSLRASLLWEPNEQFDGLFLVEYGEDNSEVLAFEHAGNLFADGSPGLCSFGDSSAGIRNEFECASFAQQRDAVGGNAIGEVQAVQDQDGPRTVGASFSYGNEIDADSLGVAATLNFHFDRMTLTSVTGYRDFDREMGTDQGGSPFVISDNFRIMQIESVSQELRLASDESWGDLKWMVGAYYGKDENFDSVDFNFRDHASFSGLFNSSFTQDTENKALFAQAEWSLGDDWRLISGLRYTKEDRELNYGGTLAGGGPTPVPAFNGAISTSEVSGKLGIDYIVSDDVLFYASVNRGFKGGGFPAEISFNPADLAPYEPETLWAYEAGFKSTLADGRLRFNSALYHYDWQDFQASTAIDRAGIRVIVLSNSGDAEITGLESEIAWVPTDELSFMLGFNWMDAEIVSGIHEGLTPAHSPEISFNGIARYDSSATVFSDFRPFAQIDVNYTDDTQFILPNHPGAASDAYTLVNLRFGVKSQDDRWEIAGWIQNAGDKLYRSEVFGPGSSFLPGRIHYGAPRLFGISIGYNR